MPITPLHFGLIPLINRVLHRKISTKAFIIANIVTDIPVLMFMYMKKVQELGGPEVTGTMHSVPGHTFASALILGIFLGVFGFKSTACWLGCILGTLTHVSLDMFVHADMQPFMPWFTGNPFYFDGAYDIFSIGLMVGLVFLILDAIDQLKADRQLAKTSPLEHHV